MAFAFSDLQKWVLDWESPVMEFKLSAPKDIGETICAFTNTSGGIIIFGIEEKKREFRGLSNPDEESKRLRQDLEICKPLPKTEQEFIKHEGKTFIVMKIEPFANSQNPCFFKKKCFVRQGTTNLELAGDDLIEFLKRRAVLNFEELRSGATLADLDHAKIKRLLIKRKISHDDFKDDDFKRILAGLGVANYNGEFYLKNAALLFFAKEPQRFFSNLEVRIVKYSTSVPELAAIKLDKRLYGTIPELIGETIGAVIENVDKTLVLEGPERKERPIYPPDAVREVITNALGHRDYFQSKDVLVEIFADRVQITSPGGLLAGQNITNFDRTPQHRNPITYRLLHDLGLGEGLGLGVRLIRKQCREAKLPDPEFFELGNTFQVILYNHVSDRKRLAADFESPRQKQLLAYLKKNQRVKSVQYAELVGVSSPTAINDLNELIKQGKIRKVGKFRGAYYVLGEYIK